MDEELDKVSSDTPSIGDELMRFIRHIDSLSGTIDPMMFAISEIRKSHIKKLNELEKKHGEIEENENGSKIIKFDPERGFEYIKLVARLGKYHLADKLIPRSIAISLISQYDVFLGRLIRVLSILQPKSINIADKNITFSQLQNFGSVEDAREYLLEKEIDSVLRMSHSEQFDWLEEKYKLPLRKDLKIWPLFIEATERRNLFVHTDGIVSRQYLNVCKEHDVKLPKEICIGSELHVTNEYFKQVYECIFEMGVGLAHVLWRKILPDDRKAADINLNSICFDLLVEEQYKLGCTLLDFATKIPPKYSDENYRRMFIINRAQAYKWSNDQATAKSIINSEDWSASNLAFRLAIAVILDDFDEADKIVREIGPRGEVEEIAYREWPLFKEYRKSEGFLKTFQDVFGKPYKLTRVETLKPESYSEETLQSVVEQIDISISEM
jgi:hypothetical protein